MLRLNIIANVINQILGIGFPLIVQFLIIRILSINDIGVWNIAISFSSMMIALSGSYYIFQVNKITSTNDNNDISVYISSGLFFSLLLSIPLSILNYIYILSIFDGFYILAMLSSFMVLLCPFSLDYYYQANQQNHYILYRRIIFRILTIILIFLNVEDQSDFNVFVIIMIISLIGETLTSFFFARQKFKIHNISFLWLKDNLNGVFGHMLFAATYGISSYLTITLLPLFFEDDGLSVVSIIMRIIFLATTVITSNSIVLLAYISSDNVENTKYIRNIGLFGFAAFIFLNVFSDVIFYIFLDEYTVKNIDFIFLVSTSYIFIHCIYNQVIFNNFVAKDLLKTPILLEVIFLISYWAMLLILNESISYISFAVALVCSRLISCSILSIFVTFKKRIFT